MLGILFSDPKKLVFASGQEVRNRCFVKMPHVVELMAVDNESVGFVPHHTSGGAHLRGVRRVKVTVRFLGRRNHIYDLVELSFEFRIILELSEIGGTFHHFVQVRIDEAMGAVIFHFFSCQIISGRLEVIHTRFSLFKSERN